MSWLSIALLAYFLFTVALVIDKTILKKAIRNPFVYAFYIAALGAVIVLFIIPFALRWPGWSQFWISLAAGATLSIGLVLMFFGLRKEDASRLAPMIGGITPIFVFILAYFFLNEALTSKQILAFVLIVVGTFLISLEFNRQRGIKTRLKQQLTGRHVYDLPKVRRTLWLALPAAIFFAISLVLSKDVYNHQPFWSGFIWRGLGALIIVLLPMLLKRNRHDLMHPPKDKGIAKVKGRFLFGQACGGAGGVLVQYAVSLGPASLVQALQGTQYVFVFLAVLFLTYYYPKFLKEEMSRQIIFQKVLAILFIAAGLYLIV